MGPIPTPDSIDSRPTDDVGSETLARYDYQVSLTAVECVRCLGDETITEVICEWWEDFVVVRLTGPELVSVKHREPSQGAWSVAKLIDDGGLRHLFERWKRMDKKAKCRLLTNAGLKQGPNEAAAVKRATLGEGVDEIASALQTRLGADIVDDVHEFLSALEIEAELPKRDDLLAKLLIDVLPPLCSSLSWPPDEIAERFEAIRIEVARAAGSDIRAEERALSAAPQSLARARARKTITRERLHAVIARVRTDGPSKLVQKLDAGKFGPTDVERCKRLRSDWLELEYRWKTGLPGDLPSAAIRRLVQDLATMAEDRTRADAAPYGTAMRTALASMLEGETVQFGGQELTIDLLLGAAYDETDLCHVWWSPKSALSGSSS